jgi:general secretion pathway protein H
VTAARRGFTLIELMVALAIASLVLSATLIAYPKMHESMEYRGAIRGVRAAMNTARAEAARSGQAALFYVDVQARTYGVGARELGHFPDSVSVRFVVAGQEIDQRERGHIRFQPDGATTGGSVDLLRGQAGGVRIRVDWLFGSVSQETISG